jgi:hypothetical protein
VFRRSQPREAEAPSGGMERVRPGDHELPNGNITAGLIDSSERSVVEVIERL